MSKVKLHGPPLFGGEGPRLYDRAYAHNAPFAKPGPYLTVLSDADEAEFRRWVATKGVPVDPDEDPCDYDMRGYWAKAHGRGWHKGDHFPDWWKTPYDTSFSRYSKFATNDCPFDWFGNRLVDKRTGQIIIFSK